MSEAQLVSCSIWLGVGPEVRFPSKAQYLKFGPLVGTLRKLLRYDPAHVSRIDWKKLGE